jgi:enoyl-CoA hydratase
MAEVTLERDAGVARITLRAPTRRNAFTPPMVAELFDVCEQIDRDAALEAVVVCAEGESFCAGAHRDVLDAASRDPAAADNYEARA